MTIPASTIPLAKLAIYNGVIAQVNDPNVLVCYDEPGEYQPDDIISIGDVSRSVEPYQMVGSGAAGWLDETYSITVHVSVYRGGDDPRTVFERACTLAYAVETFVRTDPSLGGLVIVCWPIQGEYTSEWEEDHRGRIATVTLSIHVRARI